MSHETTHETSPLPRTPVVLVMGGLDPSGGAGLLADVQVIGRHGCHALGVVTLETVQDTLGVYRVDPGEPSRVAEQAMTAALDIAPHAIKIGALGSLAMVNRVAALLADQVFRGLPIVLDTVLRSTSGQPLLAPAALAAFRENLLPLATVITPNIPEFAWMADVVDPGWDKDDAALEAALEAFASRQRCSVLLKGGHLSGAPIDRLWSGGRLWRFSGDRLPSRNTHGTGCVLASALAARLAEGFSLADAVPLAKNYVRRAMKSAPNLGKGHGPLNLRAEVSED